MNYDALITSIADTHSQAQRGATQAVNRQLIFRNWLIGAFIKEYEQNGEDRAAYGTRLLKSLSSDLKAKTVSGVSPDMLERMRLLYDTYPQLADEISAPLVRKLDETIDEAWISAPPVRKLPASQPEPLPAAKILALTWTHLAELVRLEDPWKRAFYENECLEGNWSKRQLQRQIGSLLYERTGLSTDKKTVINHARKQASETPYTVTDLMRDPYVLEFTGLAEKPHYLEKDLETALLDHIQTFLLELGNGFCFEARQKRVTVGNEHDYIDLVFYNRILRCHLLIDLKIRAFQHGDVGQMNFYLNYWKEQMMEADDNPPVGLILCAGRESAKVEYATAGMDQQLFVSRYLVALPKPEELEALIEQDQAVFEEQAAYNAHTTHKNLPINK